MQELEALYQEIILDHNKRPRNFRLVQPQTHHAEGQNPLCGDEISVSLRLEGDRIADLGFQGEGCAISKASASLMTVALKGKTLAEAQGEFDRVLALLTSPGEPVIDLAVLGDLACLAGVRRFPARIKCATLAWHALQAALRGEGQISSE